MAGLQDIRRRIRSVKNTQQVTKAMRLITIGLTQLPPSIWMNPIPLAGPTAMAGA